MKENRLLNIVCGVLTIPLIAITGAFWFVLFFLAHSQPNMILLFGVMFVVWIVFVLEGLSHHLFGRRALPWPPLYDAHYSLTYKFVTLFVAYALFGFVVYKMSMERW